MKAVNDYGDSEYSEELQAAVASLPSKPLPPTKDQSFSTKSSIKLNWLQHSDIMPATGYRVYIKGEDDLVLSIIYDAPTSVSIFTFTAENLNMGAPYSFILSAVNFNGEGATSDPVIYTACTAPFGLRPLRVTATA